MSWEYFETRHMWDKGSQDLIKTVIIVVVGEEAGTGGVGDAI